LGFFFQFWKLLCTIDRWMSFLWGMTSICLMLFDFWKKLALQSINPIIIHASEAQKQNKRTRNWKADSDQLKRTKNRLCFNYKLHNSSDSKLF
jgi:hypothetical protein